MSRRCGLFDVCDMAIGCAVWNSPYHECAGHRFTTGRDTSSLGVDKPLLAVPHIEFRAGSPRTAYRYTVRDGGVINIWPLLVGETRALAGFKWTAHPTAFAGHSSSRVLKRMRIADRPPGTLRLGDDQDTRPTATPKSAVLAYDRDAPSARGRRRKDQPPPRDAPLGVCLDVSQRIPHTANPNHCLTHGRRLGPCIDPDQVLAAGCTSQRWLRNPDMQCASLRTSKGVRTAVETERKD